MGKIFILFIGLIFSQSLFADDSTAVVVGQGVIYHSVYKSSVGPYNIKILEIDLTNPKNKLESVLAKDVLGTGFEKTSSMAKRKSKSGHIVIGAINGDFFGISNPYNPYTFLVGSMILDEEYTFGRISQRPAFAMDKFKNLIIDNIGFSATLITSQNYFKTINAVNDTVRANTLILYNKYFGNYTRTNNLVSEIKLKRISKLVINDTVKFIVVDKRVDVGNMNYEPNEYVLSGNGSAKAFLDSSITLNDTVKILFSTNPIRGNIFTLVSGNPILVINGTIPSGLSTDVHPRTAIGFNQDSTKVFFVTVDGRQPGFSVGMSLPKLAEYMLSIGCYQAVNLDGGGSTTMVVRNKVVNSPSDAAGERSVANAILAVSEITASEVIDSFYLWPRQIQIDSTQSKKIEIYGKDIWGYEIDVLPTEVTFEVIGVPGYVDSLGYFYPQGVGSGFIKARIKNLVDSISVTVFSERIPVWSYSDAGGNLPSWFSSTASTERGLAYGYVNGNHRVYVVSRPNVLILDANTGDLIGNLNTSGITGGTFPLNDVEVTSDGVIIAANLTSSSSSSSPFKVYKWNDESSNPELIIEYNIGNYRLGDKITVIGSWVDNTATLYAAVASSNKILKWTMSNGNFNQQPTIITLSDLTNYGINPSVAPVDTGQSKFFINAGSIMPREYSPSGTFISVAPTGIVVTQSNAIRYFEKYGKKFLVTYQYGFPNENARVLNITNGLSNATIYETTPSLGDNSNNIGVSGDVAVRDYKRGIIIIYVLATNNGIGAYQITIDTLTGINENNFLPTEFFISQNYPNPFNSSTKVSYFLPAKTHVIIEIYDILGKKISTLVDEVKNNGLHILEIKNSSTGLNTSGTYFLRFQLGQKYFIRKVLFLK